jgi:ABC-2 type transport system permease protein
MNAPLGIRLSRMGAIASKEWLQILRDPSTFGIAVLLPLLLMFLFGFAVSLDTQGTRIGIYDEDRSALSSDLAATLHHNRQFTAVQGLDRNGLQRDLVAGRLRAIVVIPVDFAASVRRGKPVAVQLITDGSVPNTAAFLNAQINGLVAMWSRTKFAPRASGREMAMESGPGGAALGTSAGATTGDARIRLEPHFLYNPELKSRNFLVPGAIAIVMAMIGSMLTALVVAREWERGTMEAVLATPIAIGELIAAKLLPYFLLGMLSMVLCVAVAIHIYAIPFRGSFFSLLMISAAFLSASLGQGLLISAATKNQFAATQFSLLSGFLPSLLLSGFLFEISSMPVVIQWLSYLVPARYLIPPLETVFLTGDVWPLFWPNIFAMLGFGAFYFWRAARVTKRIVA